jgi:endonuclease YncB( thermonuclease family)
MSGEKPYLGEVVRVIDGDTLHVRAYDSARTLHRVRLYGVDAPELDQPYGVVAAAALRTKAKFHSVLVEVHCRDKYEREVAHVTMQGCDLSAYMLAQGLVWHYREYDRTERYALLEREARVAQRGLWRGEQPIAPAQWRRRRR